jgi:hypothetical protein
MSKRLITMCALSLAGILAAGAAPAAPAVPKIGDVAFTRDADTYSVTISGKGFGATPADIPCTACTPGELQIVDGVTQPAQQVVNVTSWSDTSITVTGLAAAKHDALHIAVYNRTLGNVAAWGGSVKHADDGAPVVASITAQGHGQALKLVITGSGFGDAPPDIGDDASTPYYVFTDWNAQLPGGDGFPWNAGFCGTNDCNEVLVNLESWSDTRIEMDGIGANYGVDWIVNPNDAFCVGIWPSTSTSGGTTGGTFACGRAPK